MPKVELDGELMNGYSSEQTEELDSDMGPCLDFGHAVKKAVSLVVDYKAYVQGFLGFETGAFHLSDGRLDEEGCEHLSIGDGEYDFELLGRVKMSRSEMVIMETQRGEMSPDKDLGNLNILNNMRLYI